MEKRYRKPEPASDRLCPEGHRDGGLFVWGLPSEEIQGDVKQNCVVCTSFALMITVVVL